MKITDQTTLRELEDFFERNGFQNLKVWVYRLQPREFKYEVWLEKEGEPAANVDGATLTEALQKAIDCYKEMK